MVKLRKSNESFEVRGENKKELEMSKNEKKEDNTEKKEDKQEVKKSKGGCCIIFWLMTIFKFKILKVLLKFFYY